MSEIYQQSLETRRFKYMGREEALKEAIDIATDNSRFTLEEMQIHLAELSEIAKSEGLERDYLGILADKVFEGGENGEDF